MKLGCALITGDPGFSCLSFRAQRGICFSSPQKPQKQIPRCARNDNIGQLDKNGLCATSDGMRTYYVYIMASRSRTLYTGVSRDLTRRVSEHKQKLVPGFTSRYSITRLVYYEDFRDIRAAIWREKEIKAWRRSKKIALIESRNLTWADLSEGWYGKADSSLRSE